MSVRLPTSLRNREHGHGRHDLFGRASGPGRRQPAGLGFRVRLHGRRPDRGARHPDHQLLASRDRGRHRHRQRQRHLDLHLLPDRRDHHDPADRLSQPGLHLPPLPDRQRHPVPRLLDCLRLRAEPRADDPAARAPGLQRRGDDPDGVHPGADDAAAAPAMRSTDRSRPGDGVPLRKPPRRCAAGHFGGDAGTTCKLPCFRAPLPRDPMSAQAIPRQLASTSVAARAGSENPAALATIVLSPSHNDPESGAGDLLPHRLVAGQPEALQ
jgi:hypothetical protein